MQLGECLDLAGEDLAAILRRLARQRRIPEHPALFHRHDVEESADHAVVGAQRIGFCDRKTLLAEGCDNAELAVDRVRRWQQFAERPAAHHIGSRGGVEPVGRVGLAALELLDGQRSLITFDMRAQPAVEGDLIDAMPFLDGPGARKLFVVPDALGHNDAPLFFGERHQWRAPVSAYWKRLHTSEVQVWQWRGYGPRPDRRQGAGCECRHRPWRDPLRRKHRRRRRPGSRCR